MKEPRFEKGDRVLFIDPLNKASCVGVVQHRFPYQDRQHQEEVWGYAVTWETAKGRTTSTFSEFSLDAAWVNHWRE